MRTLDTRVNETALRHVYNAIEMPSLDEGFTKLLNTTKDEHRYAHPSG